ncbi:hypothetical protein [Streptomyces sp. P17]|uniref:hypothetical protein n=1 Tax=Streptomyces sp. P17 TaxID=3074716 RepID=UPI0028F432F8|nr:hypothetical protein [Streptomyces sp. P17]MDT9696223.1 hypothetical protein [Streptomyces sp. P17]
MYRAGEIASLGALHAVRCAGRLLLVVQVEDKEVRLLDETTHRWARLPESDLIEVCTLSGPAGDELLLIGADRTRIIPRGALESLFARQPGPASLRHRRGRRHRARWPAGTQEHESWLWVRHAALLPGGDTYAVSDGIELAVLGTRDGELRRTIELPSRCTALTAAPSGELIVGTPNGLILFD